MLDFFGMNLNIIILAGQTSAHNSARHPYWNSEGVTESSECPLLNYFLLIGKLYLWDCQRSNKLPDIAGFKY